MLRLCLLLLMFASVNGAKAQKTNDALVDLLIQKGILTQDEAAKVLAEAGVQGSNHVETAKTESIWKISSAIKDIELFGDIRQRFEYRQATTPLNDRLELDRARTAVRVGFRGDLYDQFYYGFRLETSSNPRSTWITLGGSSPVPAGKSGNTVDIGQAYIGWKPTSWLDMTVGRMPNPLYTTPMVWDPDINPEGAAEHLKHRIGNATFFANFGQFLYQDNNPNYLSTNLLVYLTTNRLSSSSATTFMLSWQGGMEYQFSKDVSAKFAGTLYQYIGLVTNISGGGIGDAYVGEGSYGGPGSSIPYPGLTTESTVSYNQVGLNNLLIVDIPFEVNFKISRLNARLFGDFAYNLEGGDRARAAQSALATQSALSIAGGGINNPPMLSFAPQIHDVKAYQIGFAVGNGDKLGLATGSVANRHTWEFRTYWQHIEQYALDPNIIDSDIFEGRENMEGIYAAIAYGFTGNLTGTIRYGFADRINQKLGTGGSNLDIPQLNPIERYNIVQLDLAMKF